MAEQTGDLNLGNTAAWACALAPDAVEDLDAVVALSAKAVAKNPKSYPNLNTYGAILVRAGRHDEALKQLDAATAAHGEGGTALDWLFQALAWNALGEADKAGKLARKTALWMKQIESGELKSKDFPDPLPWGTRVELKTLLLETRPLTSPDSGAGSVN